MIRVRTKNSVDTTNTEQINGNFSDQTMSWVMGVQDQTVNTRRTASFMIDRFFQMTRLSGLVLDLNSKLN